MATLKAIETEVFIDFYMLVYFFIPIISLQLENLKSRSEIEALLYVTKEMTDLPLSGYSFTTEGVSDFLEHIFKIDTQHFLMMMEGFVIQGLQDSSTCYFRMHT